MSSHLALLESEILSHSLGELDFISRSGGVRCNLISGELRSFSGERDTRRISSPDSPSGDESELTLCWASARFTRPCYPPLEAEGARLLCAHGAADTPAALKCFRD